MSTETPPPATPAWLRHQNAETSGRQAYAQLLLQRDHLVAMQKLLEVGAIRGAMALAKAAIAGINGVVKP